MDFGILCPLTTNVHARIRFYSGFARLRSNISKLFLSMSSKSVVIELLVRLLQEQNLSFVIIVCEKKERKKKQKNFWCIFRRHKLNRTKKGKKKGHFDIGCFYTTVGSYTRVLSDNTTGT